MDFLNAFWIFSAYFGSFDMHLFNMQSQADKWPALSATRYQSKN